MSGRKYPQHGRNFQLSKTLPRWPTSNKPLIIFASSSSSFFHPDATSWQLKVCLLACAIEPGSPEWEWRLLHLCYYSTFSLNIVMFAFLLEECEIKLHANNCNHSNRQRNFNKKICNTLPPGCNLMCTQGNKLPSPQSNF